MRIRLLCVAVELSVRMAVHASLGLLWGPWPWQLDSHRLLQLPSNSQLASNYGLIRV